MKQESSEKQDNSVSCSKIVVKQEPRSEVVVKEEPIPDKQDNSVSFPETVVKQEPRSEIVVKEEPDHSDDEELLQQESPESEYHCEICKTSYSKREDFYEHLKEHRAFSCNICQESFKEKNELARHVQNVHDESSKPAAKKWQCTECDKSFHLQSRFRKHLLRHGPKNIVCRVCPKSFKVICDLRRHMKSVHGTVESTASDEQPENANPESSVEETDPQNVTPQSTEEVGENSIGIVIKEEPIMNQDSMGQTIDQEEKGHFPSVVKEELIIEDVLDASDGEGQDTATENTKRIKKCFFCPKEFESNYKRKKHENQCHADPESAGENSKKIKTFKCSYCPQEFESQYFRQKHEHQSHEHLISLRETKKVKYHPDENGLFHCNECNQKFSFRCRLSAHMMRHKRLREGTIRCEPCGKIFSTKNGLELHDAATHGIHRSRETKRVIPNQKYRPDADGLYRCKECNKSYSSRISFSAHVLRHQPNQATFECVPCGKTFGSKFTLKRHEANDHRRNTFTWNVKFHPDEDGLFHCEECGKSFELRSTISAHVAKHQHLRERSFACEPCGKVFVTRTNLKNHQARCKKADPAACKYLPNEDGLYHCGECSRTFAAVRNFAAHVVRHERIRERTFLCVPCNRSYTTSHSLKTHEAKFHTGSAKMSKSRKELNEWKKKGE